MKAFAPALLALSIAAPAAAAEPPIRPGCWESVNEVTAPLHTTSTTRKLISATDVDKFLTGPINHHYTCVYPDRRVGGGKLVMKGTCTDNKGRKVEVDSTGSYTPTSFRVEANFATTMLGLPISGRGTTTAHRLGDACPAEAPKS